MINIRKSPLPVALAIAATLVAAQGVAEDTKDSQPLPAVKIEANSDQQPSSTLAGNLYFTDENGNPRNPTAEELISAGEDFQKDLARIAGENKGKPMETTHSHGATSAVVALSKLQFLVAETDEDGNLVVNHGSLDENGNILTPSASELPEM